jgi:hypothetical protein
VPAIVVSVEVAGAVRLQLPLPLPLFCSSFPRKRESSDFAVASAVLLLVIPAEAGSTPPQPKAGHPVHGLPVIPAKAGIQWLCFNNEWQD